MNDEVLTLAQLLACPARLAALRVVAERARGVSEVAFEVGISVSTASHHLGLLLAARMVRVRRAGRKRIYGLGEKRWFVAMDAPTQASAKGSQA